MLVTLEELEADYIKLIFIHIKGSFLLKIGEASSAPIELVSCNNEATLMPEMAVKIRESYFEDFLDHETGFILNNGFYEKAIGANELQLSFPEDEDSKSLFHH